MQLYLLQHGECEKKEIDVKRPLTNKGEVGIQELSKLLRNSKITLIYCSTKLRAKQTAEIIAKGARVKQRKDILPNDSIMPIVKEIKSVKEDLMIVGHLPFLSKLASRLLIGKQNKKIVSFVPGALLHLKQCDKGWAIEQFISN